MQQGKGEREAEAEKRRRTGDAEVSSFARLIESRMGSKLRLNNSTAEVVRDSEGHKVSISALGGR